MKNLLFPMLVILVVAAGCTYLPAGLFPNQPPTAWIDLISPTEASPGETVTFDGHGTDPDGTVVAYRWQSSLDGDLSARASFETSSLSEGAHIISLKVQDNNGGWSDEVRARVSVSGVTAGAPVVNSFDANPGSISLGASSTLSWNVSGATTVSIEQGIGNVALTGTRVVSPSTTMVYTLTATNAGGSVTATAQVIVTGATPGGLPVINSFIANPGSITAGDSTTLSWNVSDATGVSIDPGVGAVGATGSLSVSPPATTGYTLTATNAAGWRSRTITVVVGATPAPGEPDLVIQDISRSGATINYKIKNEGDAPAGASTSALVIDGVVKGYDAVTSLPAGMSSTESFGYLYTCSGSSDTIVVHADKDNVWTAPL